MCIAATVRGALRRGFSVVLPRDGHATYDVPANGHAPAVPAASLAVPREKPMADRDR